MADLIYPCYIDALAIYARSEGVGSVLGQEIPSSFQTSESFKTLEWSYGEGYTTALDQLCAVERTAKLLGHNPSDIGLAALIYGRWIAIDQSRLTMEH
jgi:hypothetical protein